MLALCLLLFATPVELSLKREAEITGPDIHLADLLTRESSARLAELGIGNHAVGEAPRFPRTRLIARAFLAEELGNRKTGLELNWSGPSAVLVKAAASVFSPESLESAVRDWFASQQPASGSISLDRLSIPNPGALPAGEVRFEVRARPNDDLIGVGALFVDLFINDQRYRTLSVSYQTSVELLVAKLERDLERGQTIGEADLSWSYQRMDRIASPLIKPGEALNLRAKTPLRSGMILDRRSVEAIPLVERNQEVSVLASKGRLTIRLVGVAIDNGALGDKIRIKNPTSGELITAEVSAPGEARIKL